jgi:hypothetical protein
MKNFITWVVLYWLYMGLNIEKVQAQTCEALQHCATKGCVLYYDHKPWFALAFEKLSFTTNEKQLLLQKICRFTSWSYFATDKTVYQIMQDTNINLTQKKLLVLRLVGEPIPESLETCWKQYQLYLKEVTIRTLDASNRSKVGEYIEQEKEQAKKELEQEKRGVELLDKLMQPR